MPFVFKFDKENFINTSKNNFTNISLNDKNNAI